MSNAIPALRHVVRWVIYITIITFGSLLLAPFVETYIDRGLPPSDLVPYLLRFIATSALGATVALCGLMMVIKELIQLALLRTRTRDTNAPDRDVVFLNLWFGTTGRVKRSTYWGCSMLLWLLGAAWIFAIFEFHDQDLLLRAWLLGGIVMFWAWLAVNMKRCHDRDRSGVILLATLIPFGFLWLIIELGFIAGTEGPNGYGPDPRGSSHHK